MQRHQSEVAQLHEGPKLPVGVKSLLPFFGELLFDVAALHDGHASEEGSDSDGRKERLVSGSSSSRGRELLSLDDDVALQELVPGGSDRTEDAYGSESDWKAAERERVTNRRRKESCA